MLVEHRLQIIRSYNARLRAGGERKQVLLALRKEWRQKLGKRDYPFSVESFYRWARKFRVRLSSSKMTQHDTGKS